MQTYTFICFQKMLPLKPEIKKCRPEKKRHPKFDSNCQIIHQCKNAEATSVIKKTLIVRGREGRKEGVFVRERDILGQEDLLEKG